MASPKAPSKGWIGGPVFDGAFFYAPAYLAVAIGVACVHSPRLIAPLWWAWILLVDGPHLAASFLRTMLSPTSRARYRAVFLPSLVAFLVPIGFWGIDLVLPDHGIFAALLLLAAVASYFHLARQHYGIMRIFEARGAADSATRRADQRVLTVVLVAFAILPLGLLTANRHVLGLPPVLAEEIAWVGWGILSAVGFYAATYLVRALSSRKGPPQAAVFVAGAVTPLLFFAYGWVGIKEPLFGSPVDAEHFLLVVTIMLGLQHGMEYLGIVFFVHSKGVCLKAYAMCLALTAIYFVVCAARGNSPDLSWLPLGTPEARLGLAVYWGLFFQHYYLDQKIWRVSSDATLRRELLLNER